MSDLNYLTISGRLTRDAEQGYTPNGKAMIKFSVANSTGFGDKEKTGYFNCSIFGKRAESQKLAGCLTKGTAVTVVGELTLNEYESQGIKKVALQVFVRDLSFVPNGQKQPSQHEQQKQNGYQPQGDDDFSDDIPF